VNDQPKTGVELFGKARLAETLDLSLRTIDRLLAAGELPSVQIGRRRLVRQSDLRVWLAARSAR